MANPIMIMLFLAAQFKQVKNKLGKTKPHASSLQHSKPCSGQLPLQCQQSTAMRYISKANPSQAALPLITALAVTSLVIRLLSRKEQQTKPVTHAVKD